MSHYYAQLDEAGIVTSVTQAAGAIDAPHLVALPALDHALLGQVYNPATGGFSAPPALPAPVFTRLTKLGFRGRFAQAEKTAIELASLDDPAAAMAQRAQAADIRVYLADVASATYIDPQRPETRAGVQALEAAGLIGAGRALQILDAPIQATEAFMGQV